MHNYWPQESMNDYTEDTLTKAATENQILIHILKLHKQIYYENKLCQDMLQQYYKVSNIKTGIAEK